MATEQRGFVDGQCVAGSDLSGSQYKYVKLTGANQVDLCTASTDKVYGVLQNKPTAGQVAEVMLVGRTKLLAGAAVAAGAELMPDGTSRAITAATAGNAQFGKALTAAAGAGILIEAFIPGTTRTL